GGGHVGHEVAVGVALDGGARDAAAGGDLPCALVSARAVGGGLDGDLGGGAGDHGEDPGVVGEGPVHGVDLGRAHQVPGEGGALVVPGGGEVGARHPAGLVHEGPGGRHVGHEVAVGVALDGVAGDRASGHHVLGPHVGARAVGGGLDGDLGGGAGDPRSLHDALPICPVHGVDLGRAHQVPGEGGALVVPGGGEVGA